MTIKNITAREILNSGATATIEVSVILEDGITGTASVPFGASFGSHEAFILFDKDKRFGGKGMLQAVKNVETEIKEAVVGMDVRDQKKIDQTMIDLDGTPNKRRLGANAILGVSMAVARAAASSQGLELYEYIRDHLYSGPKPTTLPRPMTVVIEGGKHADDSTDFQEYSIVGDIRDPDGSTNIRESIRACAEVYLELRKVLKEKNYNVNVGNEGAYAPPGIKTNQEPWEHIMEAIARAEYEAGKDVMLAADPASTEVLAQEGEIEEGIMQYQLKKEDRFLTQDDMIEYFSTWVNEFPFISLEDPLAEDDWETWQKLTAKLGDRVRIIGDDILVTNVERLKRAIKEKTCNAILIKLNQAGTLTETIQTIEIAKDADFWTIISHRGGGETNDTSMIDLAVACGAEMVKVGISRGERVGKYNRLMEIEEQLNT